MFDLDLRNCGTTSLRLCKLHRAGEHYDVNSAVRAPVSVEERESLAVDNWLTKCKIDQPSRFSGESAGCGEHVKSFLSGVKRYFIVNSLPVSSWGVLSAQFLQGAALLSWELQFQDVVLTEGPSAVLNPAVRR